MNWFDEWKSDLKKWVEMNPPAPQKWKPQRFMIVFLYEEKHLRRLRTDDATLATAYTQQLNADTCPFILYDRFKWKRYCKNAMPTTFSLIADSVPCFERRKREANAWWKFNAAVAEYERLREMFG